MWGSVVTFHGLLRNPTLFVVMNLAGNKLFNNIYYKSYLLNSTILKSFVKFKLILTMKLFYLLLWSNRIVLLSPVILINHTDVNIDKNI